MNRTIMTIFLILTILGAGCTEEQNDTSDISDDAIIKHLRYGAFTLPEMAVSELIIDSSSVNLSYYDYEGNLTARYVKPLNEDARDSLIELFENNAFQEMEGSYEPEEGQPVITDTGVLEISITQNEVTKTVKVDPYANFYMPDELVEIDEALNELRTYAMSVTEEEARDIAEEWIMNAPTYSFDGSNLKLQDQQFNEEETDRHILTYSFISNHGGYGNRSGQIVTAVLTDHTIVVELYKGEVVSAIIDGEWNEAGQRIQEVPVEMHSAEMYCAQAPWQLWYAEGDIKFLVEPTEEELVTTYFSTVYGIEVSEFSSTTLKDGKCQYTLKVEHGYVDTLEEMGWQET